MRHKSWNRELNLFWLALSFFSRLPVPATLIYSPTHLNRACRYFAVVGWTLALILVVVYAGLQLWFDPAISCLLLLVASLMLTGAFHEDGLADTADGLGGGKDPAHKLSIMKDSRLGTYGVSTLCLSLLLKWLCWQQLAVQQQLVTGLLIAYPLSRAIAASLIFSLPYVGLTDEGQSKSKPLAMAMTSRELWILLLTGSAGLVWLNFSATLVMLALLLGIRTLLKYWFKRQLGGITGDCLGAAQQITEAVIYLFLIAAVDVFELTGVM